MPVVGTRVRITAAFTNSVGALFDPASLKLTLSHSTGSRSAVGQRVYVYGTDVEIVRDSVGKYYFEVLLNEVGSWRYRWASAAANEESVVEGTVIATALGF